jgi:hypothetical protein
LERYEALTDIENSRRSRKSGIELNDAQRSQMQRLAEHVDKVTESDRLYFEQHPDRKHRLRHTHLAELAQHEIVQGMAICADPGRRFFTLVRNVAPGVRLRLLFQGPEAGETDIDEDMAGALFDTHATPQTWEAEAALRKVAEARG